MAAAGQSRSRGGKASAGLRLSELLRAVRGLEEDGNPQHRVRVEYNADTLLIHISGEVGQGWTTVAIDRAAREWSIAQRRRQLEAAQTAYADSMFELGRKL